MTPPAPDARAVAEPAYRWYRAIGLLKDIEAEMEALKLPEGR